MSGLIVTGSQWGDEGKGKAVDVLSAGADYIVRYQGGSNAGHTLNIKGQKKILHLIPSGIFHPHAVCVISAGVALDIEALLDEIKLIKQTGPYLEDPRRLLVSGSATLLLDYHRVLDKAREKSVKGVKIGTTGKGIGPAYEDRAGRKALLFSDLFANKNTLRLKLEKAIGEKKFLLEHFYKISSVSLEKTLRRMLSLRDQLKCYLCKDSSAVIHKALKNNKKVLFEGAQGSLLDLLHGTYPYVTATNTVAGAALPGVGIGPRSIQKVLAVAKAYTTRVGEGPFPTECAGKENDLLQKAGEEWGATTGRMRRCGWLDLPALHYALRINGAGALILMKLDVLSGLKEIPVCTAYKLKGKTITHYPVSSSDLKMVKAVYQKLPGWQEDISLIKTFEKLPKPAQRYIKFIEKELKTPVDMISVGPSRSATICLRPIF